MVIGIRWFFSTGFCVRDILLYYLYLYDIILLCYRFCSDTRKRAWENFMDFYFVFCRPEKRTLRMHCCSAGDRRFQLLNLFHVFFFFLNTAKPYSNRKFTTKTFIILWLRTMTFCSRVLEFFPEKNSLFNIEYCENNNIMTVFFSRPGITHRIL